MLRRKRWCQGNKQLTMVMYLPFLSPLNSNFTFFFFFIRTKHEKMKEIESTFQHSVFNTYLYIAMEPRSLNMLLLLVCVIRNGFNFRPHLKISKSTQISWQSAGWIQSDIVGVEIRFKISLFSFLHVYIRCSVTL